jgi:hypothetical protein
MLLPQPYDDLATSVFYISFHHRMHTIFKPEFSSPTTVLRHTNSYFNLPTDMRVQKIPRPLDCCIGTLYLNEGIIEDNIYFTTLYIATLASSFVSDHILVVRVESFAYFALTIEATDLGTES